MNLYMPPHIFRLTNFRVPPKVEIGPDGKPRLMCVTFLLKSSLLTIEVVSSSEAEDHEPVDCKVEDNGYNMPASPSWSSQPSPTSPVENPFHGNSMYPLSSGQGHGGSNGYGRTSGGNDRWPVQGDSLLSPLHRQDMSWSPSSSTLSSSHTMGRRREDSLLQSENNWPSIHSQSNRWQGQQQESSSSSNANGLYPDRTRVRSATHSYDESQMVSRRENGGLQHIYPIRYTPHTPHPTGTREGALQRLHWHSRDTPDNSRDARRGASQGNGTFSPSPTLPFTHQGYHTSTPTYTSTWTSADANLLTTPTLHSINNQSTISYDGTYSSAPVASPEYATGVDEFRDS